MSALGVAGVVAVGVDVAADAVKGIVDNNNRNVDAGYQRQLRGVALTGNR